MSCIKKAIIMVLEQNIILIIPWRRESVGVHGEGPGGRPRADVPPPTAAVTDDNLVVSLVLGDGGGGGGGRPRRAAAGKH